MEGKALSLQSYAEIDEADNISIYLKVPASVDKLLKKWSTLYTVSFDYLYDGGLVVTFNKARKDLILDKAFY